MRCRYLADGQCKNKATVWYHSIGICDEHKALLTKLIESKGNAAEFVVIPTKRRRTSRAVDLGDSPALEGVSTPEVLSAGQAGTTPAPNH